MKKPIPIKWTKNAVTDMKYWHKNNPKMVKRIEILLDDIKQNPFFGIGKPEPVKHELKGYWSRRINGEHRITYRFNQTLQFVSIIQCRYHYRK